MIANSHFLLHCFPNDSIPVNRVVSAYCLGTWALALCSIEISIFRLLNCSFFMVEGLKWRKKGELLFRWLLLQQSPILTYTKLLGLFIFDHTFGENLLWHVKALQFRSIWLLECLVDMMERLARNALVNLVTINNVNYINHHKIM